MRDASYESSIWDSKIKKTMIVTFMFLAAGMMFSWEYGRIQGRIVQNRPADTAAVEEQFWGQIRFLNPGYPSELRSDVTQMGWRVCNKLESGWDPTRVLSFLSEDSGGADADKLPTPAAQVRFWIGVEQSAVMSLCPLQASKLDGWLESFEPAKLTLPEPA